MQDMLSLVDFISGIPETLQEILKIFMIIGTLLASIQCFFGYKLRKFWIAVSGFCIGGLIGGIIGAILGISNGGSNPLTSLGFLLGAILGAWLSFKLYLLGIFIFGFFSGTVLGIVFGCLMGLDLQQVITFGCILGLISAILVVAINKPFIICVTAITSGYQIGLAVGAIAQSPEIGLLMGTIMTIAGLWYQLKSNNSNQCECLVSDTVIKKERDFSVDHTYEQIHRQDIDEGQDGLLRLSDIFVPNIIDELYYVFGHNQLVNMSFLPQQYENDEWLCACGLKNTSDECIVCGMLKNDAFNKLNYAYLNKHREDRLQHEEEERKKKQQANKQLIDEKVTIVKRHLMRSKDKTIEIYKSQIIPTIKKRLVQLKAFKNKMLPLVQLVQLKIKYFLKILFNSNHKRKTYSLLVSVISIAVILGLYKTQPKIQAFVLCNSANIVSWVSYDKSMYMYEKTLTLESDNADAFKGLYKGYMKNNNLQQGVNILNLAISECSHSDYFKKELEQYLPSNPVFEGEETEFKEFATITIKNAESPYDTKIYYTLEKDNAKDPDSSDSLYEDGILLDKPGNLVVKVIAINSLGLSSQIVEKNFTMNLPIPDPPVISAKGGIYHTPLNITLQGKDDNTKVYYTIDGSDPTKDSNLYTAPITLSLGDTMLTAVTINSFNIASSKIKERFIITYEKSGNVSNGGYVTDDGTYEYRANREGITRVDKRGNNPETISTSRGKSLNIYRDYLYFIDDKGYIKKLNTLNKNEEQILDQQVDTLVITDDTLYFIASLDHYLYSASLDGQNVKQLIMQPIKKLEALNDTLYYIASSDECIYQYSNGKVKMVKDKNCSAFAITSTYLLFSSEGNTYICDPNGQNEKILGSKSQRKQDDTIPFFGGYITTGEIYTTITYDNAILCNYYAYYRKTSTYETYNMAGNLKDSSASSSWIRYNILTGDKSEISSSKIYVTDSAIYNNSFKRTVVLQDFSN